MHSARYLSPPAGGLISGRPPTQLFMLFCLWLFIALPTQAQECTLNDAYPIYQPTNGRLQIPALAIVDATTTTQQVLQANLRLVEQTAQGLWFELVDATLSAIPAAAARARYDVLTNVADLDGYVLDEAGNTTLFAAAQLTLDTTNGRFLLTHTTAKPFPVQPAAYIGDENVFELIRSGANQFLLPVEVGGQTLKLLVDTGSDALLVFEDRLADCNTALQTRETRRIRAGDARIAKAYADGAREGVLATTSVRIGAYYHPAMKIMLVQSPDSQNDPSLTAKGADGIIGLRRTAGLNFNDDTVLLDAPLSVLQPAITTLELNLPPSGKATLAFGVQPTLERANANFLVRAKALAIPDPNNRVQLQTFADMQVPFRAKTRYGEASGEQLDLLLDTGAVSRLVLDTQVAVQLGYDPTTDTWALDDDEEIELNLVSLNDTMTLYPKFKVGEVSVAPYSTMGVAFEAVLGISHWQAFVVGFDYLSSTEGEADGTISLLRRVDLHALAPEAPKLGNDFVALDGLNSTGNEAYPSIDHSGNLIAFQSDRSDGAGGTDVYVWQRDQGLLALPGLNTAADEGKPRLSNDGRFLVYEADNSTTVGLYDIAQQQVVDLFGVNSNAVDKTPVLSSDGRYLAFVSERNGSEDIFLYDRQNNSFINLLGVNTDAKEHLPDLSRDGRLLIFSRATVSADGTRSAIIQLYDLQNGDLSPLSNGLRAINTDFSAHQPALHLGSSRLAFHSNRNNPQLGLFDRDLFVVELRTQLPITQLGLNSDFDDTQPQFSGDGNLLVFQTRRAGGLGGSDIALYEFTAATDTVVSNDNLPTPDIHFTAQEGGQFSAPLNVGGQAMNLLVDMNFNALLVFRDSAAGLADTGEPVTITLGTSQINGTLATANIRLGQYQALDMQVVIADRSAAEAALLGLSTNGMDGILGLSIARTASTPDIPLQALQPAINMWEVNFGSAAGLTLGQRPATSSNAMHTEIVAFNQSADDVNQLRVPFVALAYNADSPLPLLSFGLPPVEDLLNSVDTSLPTLSLDLPQVDGLMQGVPRAALTTLLHDEVVLTPQVAQALGYDATTQRWGMVHSIDLSFLLRGSFSLLPTAQQIPVDKIVVAAMDGMDALLGRVYWQHYTFGIDYPASASNGLLFLANNQRPSDNTDWRAFSGNQFIPLSGLNSFADEENASFSVDARLIAFQSNRNNGDADIYVWHAEQGLLNLPNLNSTEADTNPSLSNDGRLLAFESTRNGQADVFVYDLQNQTFLDLPNLNTSAPERNPSLSADGMLLSYVSQRDGLRNGSGDVYLYDLSAQRTQRLRSGWLNTDGNEGEPMLSADGSLLTFSGRDRADGIGRGDVYLYNLNRRGLVELPRLHSPFMDATPTLSLDDNFLAFSSRRYAPQLGHLGDDILLMELSSGELLGVPGLNSAYTDTDPALSADAEFILFSSNRPSGAGGKDLYLYHRDLADDTRYLVSDAYLEDGYVTDAQGRPLPNATVQVVDGDGNALGETVTDNKGQFNFLVPAGAVMSISYHSPHGEVVTDEVGDDTYVPDFEAGNLQFTQVWIEDTLQAGLPSTLWFDVETETPKFNTFVKIYLVKLPTGNVNDLDLSNFTPDYALTAMNIERLGQAAASRLASIANQITRRQGPDISTATTFLSDNNRKARVEHSFIVPADVEAGTYAAVFSIGRFDYNPEDNALQSESMVDLQDNFLAAPTRLTVQKPTLPNLRIVAAALNSNSFELPAQRPTEDSLPFGADLVLNLEIESLAQDVSLPVNVGFALNIDGQRYPLSFADNQGRQPSKAALKTYPVLCLPEIRTGFPQGDRCAALFREEQQGFTYQLYLNGDAYDALAAKTVDTQVELVVQLDPLLTIPEWANDTTDNTKVMPVMFLASQQTTFSALGGVRSGVKVNDVGVENWPSITDYGTDFFTPLNEAKTYGNSDFGVGYTFKAGLTYAEGSFDNGSSVTTYPSAAALDATGNEVYVTIFGNQVDMLTVDMGADFNGNQILCTWFGYDVGIIADQKTWQAYIHVDGIDPTACNSGSDVQAIELWNSQDDDGNELYTLSKSKDYEKSFVVGTIPITVAAGATGDLGIRGDVTIDTTNTVDIEVGPYLALTGYAEGGIGTKGLSAGIGIELLILEVDLPFHTTLQVQLAPAPLGIFTFEAPIIISTLDGKFYLYAKVLWDKYTYTIVKWDGLEWEKALMDPVWQVWAQPDQFVYVERPNNLPSFAIEGATPALDYDWGNQSGFMAAWQGDFNFEAGHYIFSAEVDDYVTVRMDEDGDNVHESILFELNDGIAVDLAATNNGTLQNGPFITTADALSGVGASGSMIFDGDNDYIELPDNPIPTGVGTIEHWVKLSSTGSRDVLVYTGDNSGGDAYDGFGHGGNSSVEIHTAIEDNGRARFHFEQINDSTRAVVESNTVLAVNTWYHIAATYDYNGELKLYVNGVLEKTENIASEGYGLRTPANYNGFKSRIGRPLSNRRHFGGSLDEVRIWNDIRTEAEIRDNMNRQLAGNEAGLVAYYRFDSPDTINTTAVEIAEDTLLGLDVAYQNVSGPANISLSWQQSGSFNATYYDSTNWSGDPAWTAVESTIDHDWGTGNPGGGEYGITDGTFSVLWDGAFAFPELTNAQDYVFMVTTDDANAQLYVNGGLQTLTAISGTDIAYAVVNLTASSHRIQLRYRHTGGDAKVKLDFQPANIWLSEEYVAITDSTLVTVETEEDSSENSLFDDNPGPSETPRTYQNVTTESELIRTGLVSTANFNFSGVYNEPYISALEEVYVDDYDFTTVGIGVAKNQQTSGYEIHSYDLLHYYRGFFYFAAGDYDFITRIDDGMKLFINGQEYLGQFDIGQAAAYVIPVTLSEGYHLIEVAHYDEVTEGSYAVRELEWTRRENDEFIGFYYNTKTDMDADDPWDAETYDGSEPLLISKDTDVVTGCAFSSHSLNCSWGDSAPLANLTGVDSQSINTDHFGVRWIGDFDLSEGVYVFTAKADNNLKLWLDDVELMEASFWNATYQEAVEILTDAQTGDTHNLRVEYHENGGSADVALSWTQISPDTFNAHYFSSSDLTGTPTDGSTTSTLNYNGSANSARWVGVFEFVETDYTFSVNTDGGVRVYLDGEVIIDQWAAQNSITEYTATVAVPAGLHSLKIEYFAGNSGSPSINVGWLGTSDIAGNALVFDGVDDFAQADVADWSGSFTVEGWVKTTTQTAYTSLFSSTDNGLASSFQIDFDNVGNLQLRGATTSSAEFAVTIGAVSGAWQHIAVTFDGTTVSTYLDGELQNTATPAFNGLFTVYRIGLNRTGGLHYAGEMDELRIWNVARSQTEIQAYMNSTLNGDESNLTAYYAFDQSSGTIVTDMTGSDDATIVGDPQWVMSNATITAMAPPGSALSLDGAGDYVTLPANTWFAGDFTIESWVYLRSYNNWSRLLDVGNGADADNVFVALSKAGTGQPILSTRIGSARTDLVSQTALSLNTWHHLAVTLNGTTGTIYIDGQPVASSTNMNIPQSVMRNTAYIGRSNWSADADANARFDELRIWHVARSQAEIQAYMNRTLEGNEGDLLAYYNFDAVAGSNSTMLTDKAGNNDGILNGNPAWMSADALVSKVVAPGNALEFDGIDDYVTLSTGNDTLNGTFTVEAWAKPDDATAILGILGSRVPTDYSFDLKFMNGDRVRSAIGNGSSWLTIHATASLTYAINQWYHIAYVITPNGYTIYIDGNLAGSGTFSGTPLLFDSSHTLRIGQTGYPGEWFNGQIDEVRIWDSARSQAAIQANMNRPLTGAESGLVAYYRFDQDSGTELVDITSSNYDGILHGNPTWVSSTVPMD